MIQTPVTVEQIDNWTGKWHLIDGGRNTVIAATEPYKEELEQIAQALNDGERYRIALWNINKAAETDMDAREFSGYVAKIADNALREGAGDHE